MNLILELLYPSTCYACDAPCSRAGFCDACSNLVNPLRPPLCTTCGIPFLSKLGEDRVCGRCLADPPAFRRARSCVAYHTHDPRNPVAAAIQRYKYDRDVGLAPLLTGILVAYAGPRAQLDLIVPVPLHPARLRWRGFNQSLLLARGLGRSLGLPVAPRALRRTRPTKPQVELGEGDRRLNVKDAFAVRYGQLVATRKILLVDDVLTTGATVNECSRALLRAGATCVEVLTLARAMPH